MLEQLYQTISSFLLDLPSIGNLISKKRPDFDPRNYGFMKLSNLIKSSDAFLFDVRETANKSVKHIYIKNNI